MGRVGRSVPDPENPTLRIEQLLDDKSCQPKNADADWTREITDQLLDEFLAGVSVKSLAARFGRTEKAILRRLDRFMYNEFGVATRYHPVRRISRKGKPLTRNEITLIKKNCRSNVPPEITSKVLQRPISDFAVTYQDLKQVDAISYLGCGVDVILAYRYLRWCYNKRIMSDVAYETLLREELEFGSGGEVLKEPPSSDPDDYPKHIRYLAKYFLYKYANNSGNRLPIDISQDSKSYR
jgi:hypothetical protein